MSNLQMTDDPVDNSAHDAAMAAKGADVQVNSGKAQPDSTADFNVDPNAAPATAHERPENVPEKFWNAETGEIRQDALLEAYGKLESGRNKPDDSSSDTSEDGAEAAAEADDSVIARAQAEFEAGEGLSDETYQALEETGLDRETVDAYIAGLEATRELAFTAAGGEEAYNDMISWAENNLTPAEIAEFDETISGATPRELVKAVQGLTERYTAGRSREPNLVDGDNTPVSNEGFRSKAEMTAAMSDPRYKTDSAFREDVMRKIQSAERAGISLFM